MRKAQKITVQFYLRHKAKLNVYSLVCSNLSQPISPRRKHYFKYVRAFNFANTFIARVKFLLNIFFQRVFSNKQHKLLHVI
jgi:hypothetical protein